MTLFHPDLVRNWPHRVRVTPKAKKGAHDLPDAELKAVKEILGKPFPDDSAKHKKMGQRKDIDLRRVEVDRDVRITYRLGDDGSPVIVHIGRHTGSDAFVQTYKPKDDDRLLTLDEAKLATEPAKPAEKAIARPLPTPAAEARPDDAMTRLGSALGDVIAKLIPAETSAKTELALDEVAKLDRRAETAEARLADAERLIAALRAEAEAQVRRHDGEIAELADKLDAAERRADALADEAVVQAQAARTLAVVHERDMARVNNLVDRLTTAVHRLNGETQALRAESRVNAERHDRRDDREREERRRPGVLRAWVGGVARRVAAWLW